MSEAISHRRYVAVLALIAGGILTLGAWLRPAKKAPITIPEAERARIERLTQRRRLEDMTSYFAAIAREVDGHLVRLKQAGVNAVVWDASGLIVAADPGGLAQQPVQLQTAVGEIAAQPLVSSTGLAVATLEAPKGAGLQPARKGARELRSPGEWVLIMARRDDGGRLFAPGVFAGAVPVQCGEHRYLEVQTSASLTEAMLGGGLFDADGNLHAVVLRCGERIAAITPQGVEQAIDRAGSFEGRLLSKYGIRLAGLDDELAAHFRTQHGALVTEVRKQSRSEASGLSPGDLIVKLGDQEVRGPDDLAQLVLPAPYPAFDLIVVRGRRTVRMALRAIESKGDVGVKTAGAGILLEQPVKGYRIEAVEPGSVAERAGIQAGDMLQDIGGTRPASMAAAKRLLSSSRSTPPYAVVERGEKRILLRLK